MRKNVRVTNGLPKANALREVTSSRTSALAEKAVHLNPAGKSLVVKSLVVKSPVVKSPAARNCGGIKPREASFARANVVRCAGWMASAAG
ncbi:MAG: hypothetical protein RLZZ265_3044 [Verrucomicrobiota bacterium]|jgi:hypothetical protein